MLSARDLDGVQSDEIHWSGGVLVRGKPDKAQVKVFVCLYGGRRIRYRVARLRVGETLAEIGMRRLVKAIQTKRKWAML
jgi:hypothetical protein